MIIKGYVTRKKLARWVEANRPDVKLGSTPKAFVPYGQTVRVIEGKNWKEIAQKLGAFPLDKIV